MISFGNQISHQIYAITYSIAQLPFYAFHDHFMPYLLKMVWIVVSFLRESNQHGKFVVGQQR